MADDSEQKASPRENIGNGGKNVFSDPFYYRGESLATICYSQQ